MTRDGSAARPHRPTATMTTAPPALLYARPGIVVTADRFTVGRTTWEIVDLTHLHTTRGPHDRLAVRAVALTAAMIAALGLLLGFAGGLQRLTAGAYLTFGVLVPLPVLLAAAGDRWRPPPYELWGWHLGVEVLLFSSDDERQFDEVRRAVRRAREGARRGPGHGEWAGARPDGWGPGEPWRPAR
ncbi:DUF6232 family protein [Micromonospora okii]|uniref:DUF6232 family protein n=1 Tax=Micromonospora okii TaxID=1182970 RepID=UPI001E386F18|nr:DUF6232 family protein [Micromonospora okii]